MNDPKRLLIAVEFLGFYISSDGGETWKESSAGLIGYPRIDDPAKPCHTEFADLAVNPNNSQHMILSRAAEPGLITDYFSENAGLDETQDGGKTTNARTLNGANTVYPTVGVVRKTVNGGKSWTELPTGAPANINVLNIFIDPLNDKIVTWRLPGGLRVPLARLSIPG